MSEISILKEINKDSKMGMDALTMVTDKSQDDRFIKLLDKQHNEYQNIYDRTQELLVQNKEQMEDTPTMQKVMSWFGIQFNTLNDKSNSQLSEMLIQGNSMGIIKGTKLLNNEVFTDNQIKNILSDFIRLQEKNVEDLKKYL